MEKKYKLFVVFHQQLNAEYYKDDILPNYTFVNVNPNNDLTIIDERYDVVNQYEFKEFHPLGKWYTESEVIYNIYKNPYLYKDLDYIGFLQHDIDSTVLNKNNIKNLIDDYQHINFQPYLFKTDYNQNILMDIKYPNKRKGNGINCYDVMLKEYNEYYGTTYSLKQLQEETINLCASFILPTKVFVDMMKFVSTIIESGRLDNFDQERKYRIQGGYLERYYALWLALQNLSTSSLKLNHFFAESTMQDSIIHRVLRKLRITT
jgi:hypothetical protein